jgi:predicted nucleic acid-binding protein
MLPTLQTIPICLFDTTVFVDHLRNIPEATDLIMQAISGKLPAAFSILTDAELWAGVRDKDDARAHRLILSRLYRLPLTLTIARRAGELRKLYQSYSPKTVDMIIAATAEHHNLPIYTHNVKDYEFVTTVKVISYRP